jgi:hypothetical protein
MEYLDLIVLTTIVTVLFGVFIFGPMFHAQSKKVTKNPDDLKD